MRAVTVLRMAGAEEPMGPGRAGAGPQGPWASKEERQARLLGWATREVDASPQEPPQPLWMGSSLQGAVHDMRKPRDCRRSLHPEG